MMLLVLTMMLLPLSSTISRRMTRTRSSTCPSLLALTQQTHMPSTHSTRRGNSRPMWTLMLSTSNTTISSSTTMPTRISSTRTPMRISNSMLLMTWR